MIYLDNAATTFPKPSAVSAEVFRCMTEYCGNPGRSGHTLSLAAAKKVFECRLYLSELLGIGDPSRIVFTLNTTHALNLIIKGLLKKGDHVIISDLEHNSVLRPIKRLADEGIIEYSIFSTGSIDRHNPSLICAAIARKKKKNTRAVICTHSSNICSITLPLSEIGAFCHRNGLLFIVDAAQSAGHMRIDMDKMNIDALCAPSHKGLYGPQGAGIAAIRDGLLLDTLIEGGNGINSKDPFMPDFSPDRYEAGTLPTPAIAGLCEGVRYIKNIGIDAIHDYECELFRRARQELSNIKNVEIYKPEHIGSTLLFNKKGFLSEAVANHLNESGICVRGGFHCAPLAHKALGTPEGGAVRISFGIFNKKAEVDALARALNMLK